jgi:hypothetical protein
LVRSQPGQIVCKTLSQKTLYKNRVGGVTQGEGPEVPAPQKKNVRGGRLGMVVHVYNPSYSRDKGRKKDCYGKSARPYLKDQGMA